MSTHRFLSTYCSQCGNEFGPGDSGYSHCNQHTRGQRGTNMVCAYCGDPMRCHDNDEPTGCCGETHYVEEDEFLRMLATPPEPSEVDAAGTFVG